MKKEDSLRRFVSENRAAFEKKQPDAAVRDRIWERLGKAHAWSDTQTHNQQPVQPPVIRSLHRDRARVWYAAASVAVLLILGTIGTRLMLQKPTGNIQRENKIAGSLVPDPGTAAEQLLHPGTGEQEQSPVLEGSRVNKQALVQKAAAEQSPEEIQLSQETRITALLDPEEPASRRIEGILQMAALSELSQGLLDQLFYTVNHDPNSNVRSAAIGLLMDHLPVMQTGQAIQEVFIRQDDPSIQLELMLAMAQNDTILINEATVDRLFAIAEDPLALDFVKEQAYAVLMKTW